MQGGVNPDLGIDYYTDLLLSLRIRHPSLTSTVSPIEIEGIADVTGISTLEVLTRLKDAGMHGYQAEVLKCWLNRLGLMSLKGSPESGLM